MKDSNQKANIQEILNVINNADAAKANVAKLNAEAKQKTLNLKSEAEIARGHLQRKKEGFSELANFEFGPELRDATVAKVQLQPNPKMEKAKNLKGVHDKLFARKQT